jgi:hypothetical protein
VTLPELPRINTTDHDHYATYYNHDARQLVADLYPRDTRELGYEF